MLALLALFEPARPVWTADEIALRLDLGRGTAYRYLRSLCNAGWLARTPGGVALGPRIIEMDLAMREGDPVLAAAQPVMEGLRDRFDGDVLLVRYYDNRMVVTHREQGGLRMPMGYGRGRVMPLFQGAASKAILSTLPLSRQRKLYLAHPEAIAQSGLGRDWKEFRRRLLDIAKAGHAISHSELDPGNAGIAVNIPGTDQPSALALVFPAALFQLLDKRLLLNAVRDAANIVAAMLTRGSDEATFGLAKIPRAAALTSEAGPK